MTGRLITVSGAVVVTLACTAVPGPQAARQPVEVALTEEFSEGPVFDYDGNFFFTHGRFVTRIDPAGNRKVWIETSGANGHKVLPDGTHLLCVPGDHAVLRIDAAGKVLGAASDQCDGKPLRAPNDLTLDSHGGFYFSDPGGSREAPIGTVHYVDSQGTTHLAAGGMRVPNGLVLSLDGKTLYVAETVPNRIVKFPVLAPGELGESQLFADLPHRNGHQAEPDGLAIDSDGNLYVAHLGTNSVKVLDPQGKLIRELATPNYDTSNLVFGGPEMNQLYVTGSVGHRSNTPGRVYRLDLGAVRGISPLRPRP
jgi:gluconolactonase